MNPQNIIEYFDPYKATWLGCVLTHHFPQGISIQVVDGSSDDELESPDKRPNSQGQHHSLDQLNQNLLDCELGTSI